MSKQSEAKSKQGYTPKAILTVCMNCASYESEEVEKPGFCGSTYKVESNKRCLIGGFSVKKMGTCNEWTSK